MTLRISNAARSGACDSVVDRVDVSGPGKLRVYSGTQPAGPDTAVSGQTLLAEFTLANPAFSAASNGVATLLGTPRTTTGLAAGTATWFRVVDGAGTAVTDGAVNTASAELVLNTVTISIGVNVEITSGTVTMPG